MVKCQTSLAFSHWFLTSVIVGLNPAHHSMYDVLREPNGTLAVESDNKDSTGFHRSVLFCIIFAACSK